MKENNFVEVIRYRSNSVISVKLQNCFKTCSRPVCLF